LLKTTGSLDGSILPGKCWFFHWIRITIYNVACFTAPVFTSQVHRFQLTKCTKHVSLEHSLFIIN
jgi:hypothetical protein